MKSKPFLITGVSAALTAILLYTVGCKIDSADNVIRNVNINVAGRYQNNGARIITQHTGAAIVALNVIQDGNRLQAVCNNGLVFHGSIGSVATDSGGSRSASFTLEGPTTSGAEGVMTGTFSVSGTTSNMTGTWAEPTTFGSIRASATVTQPVTPGPTPTNGTGTNVTGNGTANAGGGTGGGTGTGTGGSSGGTGGSGGPTIGITPPVSNPPPIPS